MQKGDLYGRPEERISRGISPKRTKEFGDSPDGGSGRTCQQGIFGDGASSASGTATAMEVGQP
ncbi:MAG: hypothetical protein ACWGQW_12530 [bacterium]